MKTEGAPQQMLGRTFCPLTQSWQAPGAVPISAEVMDPLMRRGATLADLLYVLIIRDRKTL